MISIAKMKETGRALINKAIFPFQPIKSIITE